MNETGAVDSTLRKPAPDPLPDPGLDPAPEEVEIKLAASERMLEALRQHPALSGEKQCESLRTTYFDTPDGALAAGKASLRVRRRARGCEQTLKIALGRKSQMQRSEWNQPLRADAQAPDPAAFPAPAALALDQMRRGAHLLPYAELLVERETRLLRRGKVAIEVAFDTGEIRAGEIKADGRPSQPIAELELELCEGRLADLLRLALELPLGPELGWSIRTKAHRAQALAKGRPPQAVSAAPVALTRGMSAGRAFQTIGWNALAHAVGNLGLVIARGDPGAIHQLRVAIRRLRAALSLFGKDLLAGDPQAHALRQDLREAAALLAPARDLHVLAQGIKHPPEALLRAETAAVRAARDGLGQPRFQRLWLQLALWLEDGAYLASPLAGAAIEPLAATMIERQRDAVRGKRKRLAGMSDRELHDLRKDVKKLRYSAGFFQPLDKSRMARMHQDALEQVQEALGQIQDQASAIQAGVGIARLLDLPRGEALMLQSQLDAAMALPTADRAQAIEQARDGLGQEKAHAGWWEAL